ncbi:hypothetical protein CONPUDRAFT_155716 [Coniophora puteana RWD-64-598 SS2]|uniref:Uncharacterized protein n=1 Tax=Coniophora puteana (strain RWD-64-598) TaxID=741705 RepID=A0A5M3MJ63_CONPW|nr:uncharacterized protein CONPUDRAFT_155716 [Coniophora puteana RWD-64-598 SS2]EIW79027.1 hypothetical protein CONPUDRAFT_155716 [Coniophora puteana RWD-64-598 SS2]
MLKDADAIDEWWRKASSSSQFRDLKRISQCYYVHDHDPSVKQQDCRTYWIGNSLGYIIPAKTIWQFRDINSSHLRPVIPPQDEKEYSDNIILTNSFFVRSRADPRDFWHIPRRGSDANVLLVSRANRTRFRITATYAPEPLNGGPTIMIGSDAIEIAEARTGRLVGITAEGCLALLGSAAATVELIVEERGEDVAGKTDTNGGTTQIFFRDFKSKFSVVPDDDDERRLLELGDGEEWELV